MSDIQLMNWIAEYEAMKARRDCLDRGNGTQNIVRYENGDTYQHIETYETIFRKSTETIINGQTVSRKELEFHSFGWREIKATIN